MIVSFLSSVAIIATCWATFMHFGNEGYVEATREMVQVTKHIESGLVTVSAINSFYHTKYSCYSLLFETCVF